MFIQCRLSHHPQDHPRQCSAYLCIPSCIPANYEREGAGGGRLFWGDRLLEHGRLF